MHSDQWIRQGVVLTVVAGQVVESRLLSRLMIRWTVRNITRSGEDRSISFWHQLVTNPVFVDILTNQAKRLSLPPVLVYGSTALYRFPDRLRNALHKELTMRCLKTLLYSSKRDRNELHASIEALLAATPCDGSSQSCYSDPGKY
ncbi:unnamed protein product [Echinostoma caproni]|uniref:DUF4158 domain-containing protein n=1 Tax=Echinostoma caproni TaxID=27848 RepID=A0A183B3I0_9TREM|nr:unnamed protein product [Echinostoma caproni]